MTLSMYGSNFSFLHGIWFILGLSIDWRDKNIYWSSGILFGRISVVSQGGGNMYHLQTGLLHPRYLTVLALES